MLVTEETYRNVVLSSPESAAIIRDIHSLIEDTEVDIEMYPALDTLFGCIGYIASHDGAVHAYPVTQIETEQEIATEESE